MAEALAAPKTGMQKILDVVERVGNRVPHPAVIFLILIGLTMVIAHILAMTGASVTFDRLNTETDTLEKVTSSAQSLLSADGLRFMYTTMIPNFMGFTAVGLLIAAMIGAGVAEEAGLVKALIRKLVVVAPRWAMTYIIVFVGILSSVAADAGYLVLIPLAGIAFLSLGRHPIAGLAAGFASVAGAFTVNMLIKPLDAVLTEFTNDAIHMVKPSLSISLTANLWFSIASVIFLTFIITFITERFVEPRLGAFKKSDDATATQDDQGVSREESRGLAFAGLALLGVVGVFGLLTFLPGAPLRDQTTGAIIGNTPFMNHLIVFIMVLFLATGAAFGLASGKSKGITDIVKAIEKSLGGLGGLILLLFIIAQFIAYFNYTNMATILAVSLAGTLKEANIGAVWLLLGFIIVVMILDLLITGAIAKWAIFAPVFVPIFVQLGVAPEAVLAAYRIGDSPINMITPLNAYFAMVVVVCQKYDKNAGVGTVVALMLPYVVGISVLWTVLFLVWYIFGIPFGLA
jgi:aminobenzoyl-glutamate transport protein